MSHILPQRNDSGAEMDFMQRALELAEGGLGRTAPNPSVAAVVVRDCAVVAEGRHLAAGQPHAEAVALARAGQRARGATLYVTLEPCCHQGRTPACVDAIVAAGIREVRYAIVDPDPRVSGAGERSLKAAGVTVKKGEGAALANDLLRGYLKRQRHGFPWVTAKYAMTLDGKTATRTGDSRWISGAESRAYVHRLRDRADAVLVGIGTVLADDPRLTVRPAPADGRQPLRVVVDSRLRIPLDSALATELAAGTLVACVDGATKRARAPLLMARGVAVVSLPGASDGRVDVTALMAELARRGVGEVLVEGGGELLASLLAAGLVDEVTCCVAPLLLGGRGAATPLAGTGWARVADGQRLVTTTVTRRGDDVWISARVNARSEAERTVERGTQVREASR